MYSSPYNIFNFKGREILAIPSNSKAIQRISHKCFRGNSIKRRILRLGIKILIFLNLQSILSYKSNTPTPRHKDFDFILWLKEVEKKLGYGKLYAVVTYPSQVTRKRFYVNLISEEGIPLAFSKVALDSRNNYLLSNEVNTIKDLNDIKYSFNVPNLLIKGNFSYHKYLVFESIPFNSKVRSSKYNSTPLELSKELSKNTFKFRYVNELSWWDEFMKIVEVEDRKFLLNNISITPASLIEVCLVHGDLHNGNIHYGKKGTWLFDWEASYSDGPIMTDEIVFFLANYQRKIISNPIAIARKLGDKFLKKEYETMKCNVGMALAFLSISGREDAKTMIHNWIYIIEGVRGV